MQSTPATRSVLAAALAGVCMLAAGSPAVAGPATDRLRDFFGRVNGVLNDPAIQSAPLEKVARIKHLVTEIADVRGVAAAVLEREWDKRTPAERDEFARMFSELLERGLVARLAGTVSPVKGMQMSWRGESRVGDETRVMTVVESRDGRKIDVEYRMIDRRGRWLVRDVVVDGISTVENYRSQFKRVLIHEGGYAGLVAQLRKKLGEETLMFAHTPAAAIASPPKPPERTPGTRPSAPRAMPAASPPGSMPLSRQSSTTAAPKPTAKAPIVVPAAKPPAQPVAGKTVVPPVAKAPVSAADATQPGRSRSATAPGKTGPAPEIAP
jgi:phospholipid transport system substrate-binding protein